MTIILILFFSMIAFTGGYYAGRGDQPEQLIALPPQQIEVIKYVQLPPPVKTLLQEIEDARQKLKVSNLNVEEASIAKAKLEPMLKYVTAIKYNSEKEEL